MKNFHLNSFVQGSNVTFFLTSVNEELVSLLQLYSELFELCFSSSANGKYHVRFEFDYDFDKFFGDTNSNFYEVFVKACRLMVNGQAQHFLHQFRKLFMASSGDMYGSDMIENMFPISFFHLDQIDADIEIDSYEGDSYETQSRE